MRIRSRSFLFVLFALPVTAEVSAAPFGTVRLQSPGALTSMDLRTQGASLRARRNEGGDEAWALVVTTEGPRLVSGAAAGTAMAACDATLHATLALDDFDGDGRIDSRRGERARLLLAANWRNHGLWQSAVLLVQIDPSGIATITWRRDSSTLQALGMLVAPPTLLRTGRSGVDDVLVASGWTRAGLPAARTAGGELLQFDARTGQSRPSLFATDASLVSGVTAVDRDGDGRTDLLYLVDAAWRVWRLEGLDGPGAASERFAATLFADLGSAAESGAAIQFAPDVALAGSGAERHLEVSLGSSNAPAREALRHWLFVLRDPLASRLAPGAVTPLTPILPAQLRRLDAASLPSTESPPVSRGIIASLPGPLAAPVLTVAGHHIVATHASGPSDPCTLRVDEAESFEVTTLTAAFELQRSFITSERDSRLTLAQSPADAVTRQSDLECRLGSARLAQCPKVPALQRDYWLRKDAP